MAPRVISLEEQYVVADGTLRTTATLQLIDSVMATCFTVNPGHVAGVKLEGGNWEAEHHSTKDVWLRYRRSLASGAKLAVTQHVPGGLWFLAPNPVVEVSLPGLGFQDTRGEASWDFLKRGGALAATAFFGEDRQCKLMGLEVAARAKLRRGMLQSVAVSAGTQVPAVLSLKTRFPDGIKAKTSFTPGSNVVRVQATHRAAAGKGSGGGPVAITTLDVTAALPLGKAAAEPRVVLGLKWTF